MPRGHLSRAGDVRPRISTMYSRHSTASLAALLWMTTLLLGQAAGLTQKYCSTNNTADTDSAYWQYQSNGWCSTHCQDDYAFAIVQWTSCWCSNYAPAAQSDLSDCGHICPGYKIESCGDQSKGTYGYIQLNKEPSGTLGASSPAKTNDDPDKSSPSPSPSSSPKDRPDSKKSSSMTKYTTQSLYTISGNIVTQTVVATSYVEPQSAGTTDRKPSVSTGAIAGGVVGGICGLALIVAGILFFFWRHRKQQQQHMSQYGGSEAGNSGVTRNTSVLSKTGLLGSAEKGYMGPVHTSSQRSNGNDMDSVTPISERRNSRPLFYDQRLNPSALMDNDNSSRASVGTMQDNRDYTRQLNIRNPDPDSDAEPD